MSIAVDISHSVAHPGDNVTLTCRLTGVQSDAVVEWVKHVTGSRPEVIATQKELTSLYSALRRYEVEVIVLGDVILYILNVYGRLDLKWILCVQCRFSFMLIAYYMLL